MWFGLQVSPVSVWRSWLPTCLGKQGGGPKGALGICVGAWGSVLAASVLCVTLPSEGSCPVSTEGATTKVSGRWWEGGLMAWAELGVLCALPREPEGLCCLPLPPPLQAAFLLPQCLMPGHTATEYAICVGDMPPHPHPHPGHPWTPKAVVASASLQPLLPTCLHTENGA